MQANRLENSSAIHGTPALLTFPNKLGAFPFLAMKNIVREATYSDELPALMTAITITALMSDAPALIPASERAIVSGDFAVFEVLDSSRWSFQGIKMPMKNIIPT